MKSNIVLIVSIVLAFAIIAAAAIFFRPEREVTLPVEVREYADFNCAFCAQFHPTSEQLRQRYLDNENVDYEIVIFPILGTNSEQAAFAAEAAKEQGKYYEFLDALFEDTELREDEDFIAVAEELELDVEKYNSDRESEELQQKVLDRAEETRSQGISATPTITIEGRQFNSRDAEEIAAEIESVVELAE
ncbi:MAG: DsbA family protein [Candidatus Dojkabacteria bacterium]